MKVICDGLNLSDAVIKVAKAISNRTTNPILEGIKLVAKDDYLCLTGSDLELSIEKKIRAHVFEEGELVVPGRNFADFVKKLTDNQVELSLLDKRTLKIKYQESEAKFQCYDADEYPQINTSLSGENFVILEGELKDLINKILFAVAIDDSRPVLRGCLLEVNNYFITGVALDGYRLALARKAVEKFSNKLKVVVPSRSLQEISKFLENDDKVVTIYINDNTLAIEIDNTVIVSRLIEGDFVDYLRIIPTTFETIANVKREKFFDSLERVGIMSRESKTNYVTLDIKEKTFRLSSVSESGYVNEILNVGTTGKDIFLSCNNRYLQEAVKSVNDEYIKISFKSETDPLTITPIKGEEYLYLILPIRKIN